MKKCVGCEYYSEPNDYHNYCLCLYFCEMRKPIDKCIDEKAYLEVQWYEYNRLEKGIDEIFKKIDYLDGKNVKFFTDLDKNVCDIVWKNFENKEICKQKIIEYKENFLNKLLSYEMEK